MSSERQRHESVREQPCDVCKEDFWRTEFEDVANVPGVKIRWISSREGNAIGLPEGVFVETNISYDVFADRQNLENQRLSYAIGVHVMLRLMGDKQFFQIGVPAVEVSSSIAFDVTPFESEFGGRLLKIVSPTLDEVEEVLRAGERGDDSTIVSRVRRPPASN